MGRSGSFYFPETVYIDAISFAGNGAHTSPWLKVITLLLEKKSGLLSS